MFFFVIKSLFCFFFLFTEDSQSRLNRSTPIQILIVVTFIKLENIKTSPQKPHTLLLIISYTLYIAFVLYKSNMNVAKEYKYSNKEYGSLFFKPQ